MKVNFCSIIFLALLSTFSGLSYAQTTATETNTATNQTNSADAQNKAGQALKILMVINNNEIDAANLALKRSSNADVKKFAETMKNDHTQNLQDIQKLADKNNISAVDTNKSKLLAQKGAHELSKLESASDKDFDKDYIDAMVKGHKAVLDLIDTELLPKANNPEVVDYLKTTRNTVSQHLDMAKALQNSINHG